MESQSICKKLRNPEITWSLKTIIENQFAIELPICWQFSHNLKNKLLGFSMLKFDENKVKCSKSVLLSEGENSTIKINVLLNSRIVDIPFVSKFISNLEELAMVLKVIDSLKLCKCFHLNKCGTCSLYSLEFDICRPCKKLNLKSTKILIDKNSTTSNASEINDIRCSFCNKSVTNLTDLLKHEHGHLPKYNEENFECTICNVSFEESNTLVEHYGKLHSAVRFIKCTLCTEKFYSSNYVKRHMRLHKNSMKYFCENCDAEFLNNNLFENHNCKITTRKEDVKPKCYICNICSVKFSTNHLLIQHQREHQISISLKCYLCNKIFITRDELLYHKKHCKLKRFNYVCDICNIRFSCISQKMSHMNTMHIRND